MAASCLTGASAAKIEGAEVGSKNPILGNVSPLHEAISDFMKMRFPRKTWGFLATLINTSERVAKHRLSNARSYTIEELQLMLQSEDGFEVLQILMDGSQPKWWWWAKRVIATAERRRQASELDQEILLLETSRPPDVSGRRRIKGDLDAQTIQNRKFAQTETALGVLYQDIARPMDRGVAETKTTAPAKRAYAGRGR
jgi:hypothetical protein